MLIQYSNLVIAPIHRAGCVIAIKACLIFFAVISQVNAATLSKTTIPGLTADSSRVKVLPLERKIASQSVFSRTLNSNEQWVETDNKNIKALLSISTTDHSLTLTVYNQAGKEIGQFTPKSQYIVIPSVVNQIWIAGKERGEGYMHLDGKVRYSGLYGYSPNGKLNAAVSKQDTGAIKAIKPAKNGGVVALTTTGLLALDSSGTISWRVDDNSHTLVASQTGDLFGTESWDRNTQSRTLTFYGLDGAILSSLTDSTESRISILSISKNSRYIAIRKFISSKPLKWNVSILEINADKKISAYHSIAINGGPMQVEVSDDASLFGLVVNERFNQGFVNKVSSVDKVGNKLFEYVPDEIDRSNMKISIENGKITISKPSGDLKLDIMRSTP